MYITLVLHSWYMYCRTIFYKTTLTYPEHNSVLNACFECVTIGLFKITATIRYTKPEDKMESHVFTFSFLGGIL